MNEDYTHNVTFKHNGKGYSALAYYDDRIPMWETEVGMLVPTANLITCGKLPEPVPVNSHADIAEKLYKELLDAVAAKYVGKTKHETVLRYIKMAEARADRSVIDTNLM